MKFKTALKKYMRENKLSANGAALKLGMTRRGILYWKSGTHEPPEKKMAKMLNKMGV